jgi:hypothetical protein
VSTCSSAGSAAAPVASSSASKGSILAARGVRDLFLVVDGDDGVGDEPGANVARDVGHRVARRLPAGRTARRPSSGGT